MVHVKVWNVLDGKLTFRTHSQHVEHRRNTDPSFGWPRLVPWHHMDGQVRVEHQWHALEQQAWSTATFVLNAMTFFDIPDRRVLAAQHPIAGKWDFSPQTLSRRKACLTIGSLHALVFRRYSYHHWAITTGPVSVTQIIVSAILSLQVPNVTLPSNISQTLTRTVYTRQTTLFIICSVCFTLPFCLSITLCSIHIAPYVPL